ncbi:MAG: hypothetical protein E7378_00400 [Clostridiales bacterium]|nr:hypothetical protein [Clostridiales bacterium]
MAKNSDYFGLDFVVSLILAIIPITSWLCGVVTRLQEGKIFAGLVRLFLGFNIIWLLDLIFMIKDKSICRLINV